MARPRKNVTPSSAPSNPPTSNNNNKPGRPPKSANTDNSSNSNKAAAHPPPPPPDVHQDTSGGSPSTSSSLSDQPKQSQNQNQGQGHAQNQTQAQPPAFSQNPYTSPTSSDYTLQLCRHYNPPRDKNSEVLPQAKQMNQYSEAVLHKVLSMEKVPSLLMAMNGEWIVQHKEGKRIKLCNDVYLSVSRIERSEWDVTALELTISSSKRTATQLVRYVEQLHEEYMSHINNELGSKIYFFDQKEAQDYRGNPFEGTMNVKAQKKYDIVNAPKHLSFQQMPFHSNKTFDNLVGPEIDLISNRVQFFVHNREWYDAKGIPYQLGLLLSGESGTGKSSCIRAVANYTGRHVINVNFANIKTVTQLKDLFYSEEISVYRDNNSNESIKLKVPVNKRIYVLEEIDALGSTIIERRAREDYNSKTIQDEITLGDLLQVLDGNMETPGRMLIITSNHPGMLDEALIRPGRIDVIVRFGFASRDTIARMYHKLHDKQMSEDSVRRLPNDVLSPADAMEVMFRNFAREDMEDAVVTEMNARAETVQHERQNRMESIRRHMATMAERSARQATEEQEEEAAQQKEMQEMERMAPSGM